MLRVVACALLIAAVVIPVEMPAAQATNWKSVKGTDQCIDLDSIQEPPKGAIGTDTTVWLQVTCPSGAVERGIRPERFSVNCFQFDMSRGWKVTKFDASGAFTDSWPKESPIIEDICSYYTVGAW